MRKGFASRVNRVIKRADIVLEIVDARFPEQTRNKVTEKHVLENGKTLVVVLNKSDLAGPKKAKKEKARIGKEIRCVFLSARNRKGKAGIMKEIGIASKGKEVVVGIIGYPNTGKSSITNLLRGKKVALTSKKAGFTRGEQLVRISKKIMLVDTPGVIPRDESDEFGLFLVGSKNVQDLSDKELVALKLIEFIGKEKAKEFKAKFGISAKGDPETVLEKIAVSKNRVAKGGKPDIYAAANIVLEQWSKHGI